MKSTFYVNEVKQCFTYIYIYIYMCVCVCVCVFQLSLLHAPDTEFWLKSFHLHVTEFGFCLQLLRKFYWLYLEVGYDGIFD
jgi:hypothetical protein